MSLRGRALERRAHDAARCILFVGALGACSLSCARDPEALAPVSKASEAPPLPREFRAAWVATVANIDWPSKKGLSSDEQRAEIIAIVERAHDLRLNALIVQVRPSADAIYPSQLEPWTEYLSGEQGQPPSPIYDPLATWIDEAHRRGIEVHAWFNPYRAKHNLPTTSPNNAFGHVSQRKPDIVKSYGGYLWMDPGEPGSVEQTLTAITDVVRRYDVDGVHIDDYFYPYPVNDSNNVEVAFPDEPSWQAYQNKGGPQGRHAWRRTNVTDLVQKIGETVHHEKRWVKFGVSPFGIGKPIDRPKGITGFSQYDKLYADVEDWLENGYVDYLAPQLYWAIDKPAQSFPVLLEYWTGPQQNRKMRHIWPGLFTSRIEDKSKAPWKSEEIIRQTQLTRTRGQIHFSMKALMENRDGIADRLKNEVYTSEALVPASPWLDPMLPPTPFASLDAGRVKLAPGVGKRTARYAVWTKAARSAEWSFRSLPVSETTLDVDPNSVEMITVSALDRVGNESDERVSLVTKRTTTR